MSTAKAQLKIIPNTLPETARTYKAIQVQIKALEAELQPYKAILEEAALNAPGMSMNVDGIKITLSEAEREIFQLADAKQALGNKILKPFIKISMFTQLRVTEKKAA